METTKEGRERIVAAIRKTYGTVSAHPFNEPTQPREWARDMLALCRDVGMLVEALGKAVTDGQVECDTGGHGDRHSPPEPDECLACLGYTVRESKEETNGRPTSN